MAEKTEETFKYIVRNEHGELKFHSFAEIRAAYLSELVGPEDEIRELSSDKWRKAKSFPVLAGATRTPGDVWRGTQMAWIMIAVVVGSGALLLIRKGATEGNAKYAMAGLLLALALGALLVRVTVNAHKRIRPH